ncbi:MAG: replicative helicase loader/inhibitor [Clostridia bacterium]
MNSQETTQVITLLAGNYDSIAKKDKTQKQLIINTWQECLGDLDYKIVLQAVKKSIIESPYPPTIHDIRKNAIGMINPSMQKTALELWDECYKMICNGNYMTQEEFDKHSEICKKFLGSTSQLKAYASNADFNMDVVRSNFFKQYEMLAKREEEQKLLPKKMQDFIGQLADRMSVKQIGE